MKTLKNGPITIDKERKTPLKNMLVALLGIVGFIYLLNFGFGVFEFLPDTLPIVGNIDEVLAVYAVYLSLQYFDLL